MRLSMVFALLLFGCHDTSLSIGDAKDGSVDGSGSDQGGACAGLTETACVAHTGCTADYCKECSCTNTFVGCRAAAATRIMCPALGCPQRECCSAETSCSSAANTCFAPGTQGGAQPSCTVTPCAADGEVCVDNVCQGPSCGLGAANPTCPANFTCVQDNGTTSSRCVRNPCTTSAQCGSAAVCVDGACFHDAGTCSPPVP